MVTSTLANATRLQNILLASPDDDTDAKAPFAPLRFPIYELALAFCDRWVILVSLEFSRTCTIVFHSTTTMMMITHTFKYTQTRKTKSSR